MCAIVGCYLEKPTNKQIETLKKLFVESQIRGRHQTGLVFKKEGKIFRHVVGGDAKLLVKEFTWSQLEELDVLELAGHCRYSTSDLRYPQPIQIYDDYALCHNGVVTQDPPESWGRFGFDLETTNDSEILYHCRVQQKEPLLEFPNASMAVTELGSSGLRWWRNGKRPLYHVKVTNGYFICSTSNIALRAGLKNPKRCEPGVVYTPKETAKLTNVEELVP
jgi:glutamine phosphoribosylpyrophosphate amidotransferase